MSGLLTFLGGAAGTAGSIAGQAMANQSNEQLNALNRQHERELLYMQQNFAQEQAAQADERTRSLYTDLQSPEALRKQLEAAGLSVGMMYGQGGAGGSMQAGAQAESPGAQNRGTIPMQNIMDAQTMMMLANAEKAKAETQNIEEDTKKKEAETESKWRDIPVKEKQLIVMENSINRTKKEIEKINEEIKTEAQRQINIAKNTDKQESEIKYNEALTEFTNSQKAIAEKLADAQEEEILAHAKQLNASAHKLEVEAKTLEATMKYTIQEAVYSAALKEIELITKPIDKQYEWETAQAKLDEYLETAYEQGVDNQMWKDIEKEFGKGVASAIKHGIDMMSIVLKGFTGNLTKHVTYPKP